MFTSSRSISDPKRVQILGKVDLIVGGINRWFNPDGYRITLIPNSTIAIITGGGGVDTIDYADPAKPRKVQHINTGVCAASGRTYIADHQTAFVAGELGVRVLDISDPKNVQQLSKVNTGVAVYRDRVPLGCRTL